MISKNLINADIVNTGSINYKNRIINGDFQVNQRQKPVISNDSDYAVDRVFVDAINSEVVVTDEIVYSLNEGSLVTETDPFEDSSQVAMYRFEDDASGGKVTCDNDSSHNGQWKDSGGNNIDGVYDAGKFDDAASFDSSGNYIDTGFQIKESDIAVSTWFKSSQSNNIGGICTIFDNNGGWLSYSLCACGYIDSNNDLWGEDFNYKLADNQWYNMIISWDSSNKVCKIYINGNLYGTYNSAGKDVGKDGTNKNITFAYQSSENPHNFVGLLDQVRIFNKVLTDDEVRKLYVEDSKYIQKKHLRVEVNRKDSNANINPYKYKFEGQDIKDILTNDMTLSFDFMSSTTGSFDVILNTFCLDGTREQFTTSFNYNGNDFEKISITIPKGTFTKPLIDDERLGAEILIASNAQAVYSVGDVVRLTDVQLEVGSVATEFEVLPYDKQLERCMRYYERTFNNINQSVQVFNGYIKQNYGYYGYYPFKINKRVKPNVSFEEFTNTSMSSIECNPLYNMLFFVGVASADSYNGSIRFCDAKIDSEL